MTTVSMFPTKDERDYQDGLEDMKKKFRAVGLEHLAEEFYETWSPIAKSLMFPPIQVTLPACDEATANAFEAEVMKLADALKDFQMKVANERLMREFKLFIASKSK